MILDEYWFFMTSFSLFIHNNQKIDDCADLSKVSYQNEEVGFIRKKTKLGRDYFELTVRFGCIELLATSGFFGSLFSPFLGSSIKDLPTAITGLYETISTKRIFVPINEKS
jgi:hypothetical protein